jgi:RimJ/RimL family protein N-acetyltransferase
VIRLNHAADGFAIADETVPFNPVCDRVVARVDDEKLLGGVIYQAFTGVSISAHIASFDKHWLCRDLLWTMFHYPFVQLGCLKILASVPSSNLISIAFCGKLGFTTEARVSDVYPGADLLLLSMRREDCRWLALIPKGVRAGTHG